MPKFSVVISVYNKETLIKETIESVLNQSVKDFEVIIVNDGSTDRSAEAIQSITSDTITYLPLLRNIGAGAARNIGIKSAKGEYIALLDGDDLWNEHYLAEISALINVFPQHHIFATAVLKEYEHTIFPNQYSFENSKNETFIDLNYFESSYKNTLLTSSSTVIHRDVFKKIGYYNEALRNSEDTDFWIRLGVKYRIAFSTEHYVTYRYAPQSLVKVAKTVTQFSKLTEYLEEEKQDEALKKYIDLNRYSLIIKARLWNEQDKETTYLNHLDTNNLNSKQRFLLTLSPAVLRLVINFQSAMEKFGIKISAF